MTIIIVTSEEFDSIGLLGTNDVICVDTELVLFNTIEENFYKNMECLIVFYNYPIIPLPKYCIIFTIDELLFHLYGSKKDQKNIKFNKRCNHMNYIYYEIPEVLNDLIENGYECLLKTLVFAIHYRDAKFRAVFWLWCEHHPNFVILLFCNPGFVIHIQNLEFSFFLDKILKLLTERHFHQAINHICSFVSNYEFCVYLTHPRFFLVFETLNQTYPLGDLISMFTTRGFCKQIVNDTFYLYFQKFSRSTFQVQLFSSPAFISMLFTLGYMEHVEKMKHRFKTYRLFTCQAFCFYSIQCETQINELQSLFGMEYTIKLLGSECISKNLLSQEFFPIVHKIISIFGHLKDCCKLLSVSYEHLKSCYNDQILTICVDIFKPRKASKLLCKSELFVLHFHCIQKFVNLLTMDKVYRLLKHSIAFLARVEDNEFFNQIKKLRQFHSIETVYKLLSTRHICVKIENHEFSHDLNQLLLQIGEYHGCQFLCNEQFETRMQEWKILCNIISKLRNPDFLFTCSVFRNQMLHNDFEETIQQKAL